MTGNDIPTNKIEIELQISGLENSHTRDAR